MKLYYSAGSCSTSCHITLEESGLKYEAVGVDWDNPADPNVEMVVRLNPLGTLPIFVTDDGAQLDQNVAIHTYVAEKAPAAGLLPAAGTIERARAMNWLSFVASDLHKSFSPLFGLSAIVEGEKSQAEVRRWAVNNVKANLEYLDKHLAKSEFITGSNFTVVDAYAFVVISWCKWVEIPTTPYRNVEAFLGRVLARPAVQRVLKAEGLM
jgi:glutathione S-transferase